MRVIEIAGEPENGLRFSARLDNKVTVVRFERVAS